MQASLLDDLDLTQYRTELALIEQEGFGEPIEIGSFLWRVARVFSERRGGWHWTYQFRCGETGEWLFIEHHHTRFPRAIKDQLFEAVFLPASDFLFRKVRVPA